MKKNIIDSLFKKFTKGGFKVRYWDGEEVKYGEDEAKVTIIFNRPLPVNFNLSDPVLAFGEAYMDEVIDFEGSIEEIMRIIELNKEAISPYSWQSKIAGVVDKLQQKKDVQHHYDLGNDFFALFLDETMSYSCAYFKTPQDSLKQAQLNKIGHTLKKLQLKPGEKLLDIGSGWGWLIIRAAQQYGVQAVGITLSEEQYQASKKRIEELGLSGQVEVRLQNYLDLDEKESFDKIVSIGMFEHVGRGNYVKYMEKVNKLLVKGGLSILHTITGMREAGVNSWMRKYIFPGGCIPSLREIIWLFPDYDFHLIHAESLRLHYALTLDKWHQNFSKHLDRVEKMFDKRFVRMWDLYLRGCAASFRTTGLDIHQLLFSKGLNNNLPLTHEYIYK